jgi:hypothetical protein
MEYIVVSLVSVVAAYWIGKKAGQAAQSLEKTRLVIVETNNLNQQIIDKMENITAQLKEMEQNILNGQAINDRLATLANQIKEVEIK